MREVTASEEIIGKNRCPTPVAAMASVWLALLAAAGANAAWVFHVLSRSEVRMEGTPASSLDASETGRILAGVIAQPGFLAVFGYGLVAGPACALLLLRQSRGLRSMAGHLRMGACSLLLAGLIGAGQMALALQIAGHSQRRTEALLSGDQTTAVEARGRLDGAHAWSERIYAGQSILVMLGMAVMLKPVACRELPNDR